MLIGLTWGCLFYTIALMIVVTLYRIYSPWYKTILPIIFLSCLGHFIGTLAYSYLPSDSFLVFFHNATPYFHGFSTEFVQNIVWYVRHFITGNSYLGTLYFFSAFAFIGSVLWYLLFLRCARCLSIENQNYVLPALVIMCWPSFLFFTTGMGKDSLTYFLLPLIVILWHHVAYGYRYNSGYVLVLVTSIIFMSMLRPYLLLILMLTYFFSLVKKEKLKTSFVWLLMLSPLLWCLMIKLIKMVGLDDLSLMSVGSQAIFQQQMQNSGTSFPIFSHHPILVLILLPYNFVMNLFFPLFLFAKNLIGILASLENCILIMLALFFWRNREIYQYLKKQLPILHFLFLFFIIGMSFMSLINTNLGLSTRQKSMYLPFFLILAMLVWLKRKIHESYK